MASAYEPARYRAYLSEPITRCPQREKGRIQTLVQKIRSTLIAPPFETSVYVPSLVTSPEKRSDMTAEHVYLLDRIRIVEADFLLVVADRTSFGIGGAVELATSLGKPVIFFSRESQLSRFLIGTPVNATRQNTRYFISYREWRDLKQELLPLVAAVIEQLNRSEVSSIPHWELGARLRQLREERKLSEEALATRAGLVPDQIRMWEMQQSDLKAVFERYRPDEIGDISLNFRQLEQMINPGLDAIHRLCFALEVSVAALVGEQADQVPEQGPAKMFGAFHSQLRDARQESLQSRARMYDITFREYEHLSRILVDEVMESSYPSRQSHHITESEFVEALRSIRHTSFV